VSAKKLSVFALVEASGAATANPPKKHSFFTLFCAVFSGKTKRNCDF
jgi:hypothetical protein